MSQEKNYTYWVWADDFGFPTYVGWGRYVKQKRYGLKDPSTVKFEKRFAFDSELNIWLRNFETEPLRPDWFPQQRTFYHKVDARTLAVNTRKKLISQGWAILNPKPFDAMVGGGSRRPVTGPSGSFQSVREAARMLEVDPGSITLWCQQQKNGWHYVTPLENCRNESED